MTRIYRVGSLTLGCLLVVFGSLFLAHMFYPSLSYEFIYRLWPFIFILLGLEVLGSRLRSEKVQFVYDKGSIFLLILLTLFSMALAFLDTAFQYHKFYL